MNEQHILIETLGLSHFCIKEKNPIEVLKNEFSILDLSNIQIVNKIDWSFIYEKDDNSKNFILLTDLNDWSYLIWKYWDFNSNIELAKRLSKKLKTKVNYYFLDSHIATSRWIFSDNGIVTRAYFESHGIRLFDEGFNEIENEVRKSIQETFVEDIFWDLYDKTCNSIEFVNKQKRSKLTVFTGTFSDNKQL